jgi:HD-GYP domain-containing protein (c-di-GMP phosphodiesterase class II)
MQENDPDAGSGSRFSYFVQQQLVNIAKKAFQQLAALLRNAALYPPAHPSLLSSAEQLILTLEEIYSRRQEASFHIIAGELYFETFSVLIEESQAILVEEMARKDIGGVIFLPGLTRGELVSFAYLMQRDLNFFASQGGLSALLLQEGIRHITVHRVLPLSRRAETMQGEAKRKTTEIFLDAIDTVKEMVHSEHIGKALNVRRLQTVVHTMVDTILDNQDALVGLTSIKLYDEYTFAHSVNVAILSIAMGAFLSLEKHKISALGFSGMLHDIGKVTIPLEITNKADALTEAEWTIVKRHPVEGAVILSGMAGVSRLAMVAAFEHHQHYDAKGYPQTRDIVQQHPFSRIVAIADAYDALTSVRVYYNVSTPPDEAVRILLKRRGTVFDTMLVKVFVNMIGILPIGTLLRLDTGEMGLVVHQTRDLVRPRVLLLRTFDGTEKEEVSLLEMERGKYKRSIAGAIDPNRIKINLNQYFT